jgi:tetratricopeptide (TPR) repeat protein
MSASITSAQDDFLPPLARAIMPYWVLALVVFAVYGGIYSNEFLFDDNLLIQLNTYLRDWNHIGDILTKSTTSGVHIAGGFYRPVQMLLYLLVYHVDEQSTFWFHCLNLSLHIINTCLVYKLGTKLGFNAWGVFLAALVWGVHPLHTEAVTYMSATADPLFALFCLWAIIVLLPDFTPRKILQIFPLFLLGLGSKETTVMFPLLVMVCLFFTSPQRLDIRTYFRTWPLWIVSLAYVFWRMNAPGFDGPQTYANDYGLPSFANLKLYTDHPAYRIYTFLATLPLYLKLLLYPTGLHMERSFPIYTTAEAAQVLIGLGILILAGAQIFFSYRPAKTSSDASQKAKKQKPADRGSALSWGLMWLAAAHAPDTGILVTMNSLFLEHWMYLPSVGLFLGLAQTISKFLQPRPQIYAIATASIVLSFAGMLSVMTYDQNQIWRNADSFYNNIFAHGEISARAHNNLALYYSDEDRYADAIRQFNEATKVSDVYAETHYNMALTYLRMPDQSAHTQEAIENLKRSLEIDPHFYRSYILLGDIYGAILKDEAKAAAYHAQGEALLSQRQ